MKRLLFILLLAASPLCAAERPNVIFNLSNDIGETKSLIAAQPQKAQELAATLKKIRDDGRSRP